MTGNILVKAGAVFLLFMVVLIALKKCGGDEGQGYEAANPSVGGEPISEETQAVLGLEGDTEEDTVRTLIGEVRKMRVDMKQLRQENSDLKSDNKSLRDMESSIRTRINNDLKKMADNQASQTKQRLDAMASDSHNKYNTMLDKFNRNGSNAGRSGSASMDASGTIWIGSPSQPEQEGVSSLLPFLDGKAGGKDRTGIDKLPGTKGRRRGEENLEEVYTVPKNSTLVGSTALTALVGRVPVGGNVVDPYTFKVILGKDNLAANGIEVPEVAHAVASGKAVGDWTLGCVRGDIHSITFIFQDGTIRTVPKPKDISDGSQRTKEIPIGELADNFGNPCVVGKRITNAYNYLSQRIGVSAAAAAAEAAASSQTTTSTSAGGGGIGVVTSVDGSTGDYVLGKTLSNSAQEVATWLDERQSNEFDAVYVSPGQTVAIHISEEIRIDYDKTGRKTQHQKKAFGGNNRELD